MTEWRVEGGEWRTLAQQREAAYSLLYAIVGERLAVEHDGKGAPYLPGRPGLWVSVSHCRKAVAVAVSSERRVGIDVECRRRVGEELMRRVCAEDEWAAVHGAADPEMAFLQLWTRKEAVLKMRGTGIQGFGSMVDALSAEGVAVDDLDTGLADVVASLATGV